MKTIINIFIILYLSLFTGCFEKPKGELGLTVMSGLTIYIDENKKGVAGEGQTSIILDEGNHHIKVIGYTNDGEWYYQGEKDIYIGSDMKVNISIIPKKNPTKKRNARLLKAKLLLEKKQNQLKKFYQENYSRVTPNTVLNKSNGLMWQDSKDGNEVQANYRSALSVCSNLVLDNYDDWRLPSLKELSTTVDYNFKNPMAIPAFRYTSSYYITRDKITIGDGHSFKDWSIKRSVRCVRSDKRIKLHNLIKKENVIIDNNLKIMWQDTKDTTVGVARHEAIKYCKNLTLSKFDDWRVPTIKELQSIVDVEAFEYQKHYSIKSEFNYSAAHYSYLSSTQNINYGKDNYWVLNYQYGLTDSKTFLPINKNNYRNTVLIRCVRSF